ncbi:MAG: DUF5522 domain-containing protein [Saprospiraceae bacterium]
MNWQEACFSLVCFLELIGFMNQDKKDRALQLNGDNLDQINSDYYLENGFVVFTEKFLLARGNCCQNNCRHCPYRKEKSKDSLIKK